MNDDRDRTSGTASESGATLTPTRTEQSFAWIDKWIRRPIGVMAWATAILLTALY